MSTAHPTTSDWSNVRSNAGVASFNVNMTSLPVLTSLPAPSPPSAIFEELVPGDVRPVCRCVVGDERRFRPEAVVALPGGRVAVSDGHNNKVKVFSGDGRQGACIGLRGPGSVKKPRSMVALPNGVLAILDASDGSIKVYSSEGDYMYTVQDWFTDRDVSLAATPEGDLLVPHGQTLVVTSLGQHAPRRTSCTRVTTDMDLCTARGMAVSRDHVVLCGMNEDDVMFINRSNGQVDIFFKFSEHIKNWDVGLRGSFFGACFDSHNNCYIADADNNSIVLIKSDRKLIVVFHCDSWILKATRSRNFSQLDSVLLCPKFVGTNSAGELLVVEHLGKVKRLLIPKVGCSKTTRL